MRRFSIGEAIGFGWKAVQSNFLFLTALMLVFWAVSFISGKVNGSFIRTPLLFLISNVIFYAINSVLTMGAIKIAVGICDGRKPVPADIYSCYPLTLRYIGASLLFAMAVGLGLLMLVVSGIIIALWMQFFSYYIVDKNQGAIESLKSSFRDTEGAAMGLLGLWFVFLGVALAGLIALIIGLIVAIPVIMIAAAFVYRKLTGAAPSVAPAAVTAAAVSPSPFMPRQTSPSRSGINVMPSNKILLVAGGIIIVLLAGIMFTTTRSSQKREAEAAKAKVEAELAAMKKKIAELEGPPPAKKDISKLPRLALTLPAVSGQDVIVTTIYSDSGPNPEIEFIELSLKDPAEGKNVSYLASKEGEQLELTFQYKNGSLAGPVVVIPANGALGADANGEKTRMVISREGYESGFIFYTKGDQIEGMNMSSPSHMPTAQGSSGETPFTEQERKRVNDLIIVWGQNLDSVGKAIGKGDFASVDNYIDTSLKAVQAIKQMFLSHGAGPEKLEYFNAMEMMSLAYANLEEIAIVSKNPTGLNKDLAEIAQLHAETAQSLDRAAFIFDKYKSPDLAVICRNIKSEIRTMMEGLERKTGRKLI